MANGSNDFGVSFAQISWITKLLQNHDNVVKVSRSNDIQFDIQRKHGSAIRMVCLDEYTCGLARVLEAQEAFAGVGMVYVGGSWNSYTADAKEYCLKGKIGLFNTTEINRSLVPQ
jgi:hypothetical protein